MYDLLGDFVAFADGADPGEVDVIARKAEQLRIRAAGIGA